MTVCSQGIPTHSAPEPLEFGGNVGSRWLVDKLGDTQLRHLLSGASDLVGCAHGEQLVQENMAARIPCRMIGVIHAHQMPFVDHKTGRGALSRVRPLFTIAIGISRAA
jgi:hypothetical protein